MSLFLTQALIVEPWKARARENYPRARFTPKIINLTTNKNWSIEALADLYLCEIWLVKAEVSGLIYLEPKIWPRPLSPSPGSFHLWS